MVALPILAGIGTARPSIHCRFLSAPSSASMQTGRSRSARRHRARCSCRRAGSAHRTHGVRTRAWAGPAHGDRIGLRGPSRARRLFGDVHALRLGLGIRRMASGLCDRGGDGNWRHCLAKTFRNATVCQRRQSAPPGTGMEVGRTAQRIGAAPPTSLGVGSTTRMRIMTEGHGCLLLDRPRRKISLSLKVDGDAFRLSRSSRAERPRLT